MTYRVYGLLACGNANEWNRYDHGYVNEKEAGLVHVALHQRRPVGHGGIADNPAHLQAFPSRPDFQDRDNPGCHFSQIATVWPALFCQPGVDPTALRLETDEDDLVEQVQGDELSRLQLWTIDPVLQ